MTFSQNYYWYKDQKVELKEIKSKKFVLIQNSLDTLGFKTQLKRKSKTKVLKYEKQLNYGNLNTLQKEKNAKVGF